MDQWNIGAPLEVAKACNKIQGQYTSGAGSISQMAALDALNIEPAKSEEIQEMLKAFNERRDLVIGLLKEIPGIKTNVPNGAFYVGRNGKTQKLKEVLNCDT